MQHAAYTYELIFLQKPQLRDFFISNFLPWASQNSWLRAARFLALALWSEVETPGSPGPGWLGLTHQFMEGGSQSCRHAQVMSRGHSSPRQSWQQVQSHAQNPLSWVSLWDHPQCWPWLIASLCIYLITIFLFCSQCLEYIMEPEKVSSHGAGILGIESIYLSGLSFLRVWSLDSHHLGAGWKHSLSATLTCWIRMQFSKTRWWFICMLEALFELLPDLRKWFPSVYSLALQIYTQSLSFKAEFLLPGDFLLLFFFKKTFFFLVTNVHCVTLGNNKKSHKEENQNHP